MEEQSNEALWYVVHTYSCLLYTSHEEIIYFGDTGRVPYGSRSPETILQYARQDVAFLLSQNVKCIMADRKSVV